MLAILMDAGPLTALLNPNDQWKSGPGSVPNEK